MEVITVLLAANEFKQFRKAGAGIEITDSSFAVSINLYSDNGSQTNSLTGVLSGHYLKARFGAFDIKNGPVAQTVVLLAMDAGEDGGSRRQPGNVRVIDSSADKTAAGNQFVGSSAAAAAAGLGSLTGIRAVTRPVNIKTLYLSSSTAGLVQIVFCNGDPTLNPIITSGYGVNKLATSAASAAKAIRGNSAAAFPTTAELPGAIAMVGFTLAASVPFVLAMQTPIQLPAGSGLVLVGNALTRDVVMALEFEEV